MVTENLAIVNCRIFLSFRVRSLVNRMHPSVRAYLDPRPGYPEVEGCVATRTGARRSTERFPTFGDTVGLAKILRRLFFMQCVRMPFAFLYRTLINMHVQRKIHIIGMLQTI